VADRRYTPPRAQPVETYLAVLDAHGVEAGLLVQPSFLGTDNRALVAALRTHRRRLRGVAVVEPTVSEAALATFAAAGVVGIRFNLIGNEPLPDFAAADHRRLLGLIGDLGWHVEVHAEGGRWCAILPPLVAAGVPVVVDHCGRPTPGLGVACPGFQAILAAATGGRLWVKLSGPYRGNGGDVAPVVAALLERPGPERLMWGSDFPWTQFEAGRSYADCLAELEGWLPDPAARAVVAGQTPARLFGFA
jgi:predicted TIM-barrel fold metal-dependent hydrolase